MSMIFCWIYSLFIDNPLWCEVWLPILRMSYSPSSLCCLPFCHLTYCFIWYTRERRKKDEIQANPLIIPCRTHLPGCFIWVWFLFSSLAVNSLGAKATFFPSLAVPPPGIYRYHLGQRWPCHLVGITAKADRRRVPGTGGGGGRERNCGVCIGG